MTDIDNTASGASAETITVEGDVKRENAEGMIAAVLVDKFGKSEDEARHITDEVIEREYGGSPQPI